METKQTVSAFIILTFYPYNHISMRIVAIHFTSQQAGSNSSTTEILPTSIPGWEKFEANGVELWLPESYDGGNLKEDLQTVVEKIKSLGPEYENMATVIEQNPDMFAIWAFDSNIGASGSLNKYSDHL